MQQALTPEDPATKDGLCFSRNICRSCQGVRSNGLLPSGTLRKFLLYGVVGVLATGVDWGIFWIANALLQIHYESAVVCSFTAGSAVNYTLNRLLTFRSKKALTSSLFAFTVISLLSLGASLILMYVLVTFAGLRGPVFFGLTGEFIARVLTTGLMYVVNFFAHSAITFKETE